MEVYYNIDDFPHLQNAVVTAGTYDGVHKGHQKILKRLSAAADAIQGKTVVITYWPHPRKVLSPDIVKHKVLYTLQERIDLLQNYGIDHLLVIEFTKEFSLLSCEEYIDRILIRGIGTKKLIIGYDHRFGRNREGGIDYLKIHSAKFGFEVEEIPREDIDSIAVSSSNIRKALSEGDLATANRYLGIPYHLEGTVVQGKQLGRTIGYPTANIQVKDEDKIIPRDGVYAVKVKVGNTAYNGMLNIGFRPTVSGRLRSIEVNIFDFDNDIYHQKIEISFIGYLREEKKFDGLDSLSLQLAADKNNAAKALTDFNP